MERYSDIQLTLFYEQNGLFAKIIDAPAEAAANADFYLSQEGPEVAAALELLEDWLHWSEIAEKAVKWARLFGGALVVMLIDDGGGLEDPLNWNTVKSVDALHVYERPLVSPVDPGSDPEELPELYHIQSRHGNFTVHASRCLRFKNGSKLPENTSLPDFWPFGVPEAYRLMDAIREAETAHNSAAAMLDKAVQPVLKVHDLADTLAYADGEEQIRRRLEIIDLCRGLLDAVVIDYEDDFYYALSEIPPGVDKAIESTEVWLSTLSGIPERILWGKQNKYVNPWKSQKGFDQEAFEIWGDYIERTQHNLLKANLHRLLSLIFQAMVNRGELPEVPLFEVMFSTGLENNVERARRTHTKLRWGAEPQADMEMDRAKKQLAQAKTAAIYASMGAVSRKEIRRGLKRRRSG